MVDKKILDEAMSKIDCKTLERLASVIDTHKGIKNDSEYVSDHRDPFYWRICCNQLNGGEVFKIDREGYSKENHPESRFYRSQGLHILPSHDQYKDLKEVMDYIKKDFDSSEHIHEICEEQAEELKREKLVCKYTHEEEICSDVILFCGKKYRLRDEYRAEYEMDTIEEFYIKALAVSIMAESDGRCDVAKDILDKGGMAIVKNLDTESVAQLLVDLQVIALEEEWLEKENDKGIER